MIQTLPQMFHDTYLLLVSRSRERRVLRPFVHSRHVTRSHHRYSQVRWTRNQVLIDELRAGKVVFKCQLHTHCGHQSVG